MAIQGPKRLRIRFQPVATRSCALWSLTGTLTSKLDVVPLGFILVGCFNPIENITVCAYVLMIITPTRCKNRTCLKPGPRANKSSSLSNLQRWSFWSGKHLPGHEPHDAPKYKKLCPPNPHWWFIFISCFLTCQHVNGKSHFFIGPTSSNGCVSIIMLVFRGVFKHNKFHPYISTSRKIYSGRATIHGYLPYIPPKNKFHPLFLEDIPIHTFQHPHPTFDTLRVNHLDSLDSQASAR